jgi:HK97 family phage prohead protease
MKTILQAVEKEIARRGLQEEQIASILQSVPAANKRRLVGGYGSVSVVDREGHRISIPALKEAVARFMQNPEYRNAMVFHSDIQVGKVLPKWTDPETGKIYETKVDDIGFYCVIEVRSDLEIADKVWEEILQGNIRSFSIAGSSKSKSEAYENGQRFTSIDALDLMEVTFCEIPVNQLSQFDVLWDPSKVDI